MVLVLTFLPAVAGAAASADQAVRFIQSLADQAIEVLQAKDATLAEREDRFRTLLKERFAVRTISRFVIGPYWRKATPEQRSAYLELFSDWIVKTYAVRLGGYVDEEFSITGTRVNPADQDIFVGTRIVKPDSSVAYRAVWRVRRMNGSYKIIDVEVEGISMALTQQDEFKSVARRKGIDGLLEILRERIDRIDRDRS
ncbi:MAG: phospholipid-binding protein MlaC [Kiloniellales bacterium]